FALVNHKADNTSSKDWRNDTQKQIESLNDNIEKSKADIAESKLDEEIDDENMENFEWEISFQTEEKELLQARLDNNVPEFLTTPLKFVYNCSTIIFVIVLFMAVMSANTIADEYSSGTIRQILIKPVKRYKIYLSKFVAVIFSSIVLCVIVYIISLIVGLALFSKNSASIYDVVLVNGAVVKRNMLQYIVLKTLSQIFSIVVISSLTFLVATLVRSNALAIIITIVAYFATSIVGVFIRNKPFYKFILTPNLSLIDYVSKESIPFKGGTFTFSLTICLVYLLVFLTAGIMVYSKRDVY
ncbi:MAG: ABC transporter permease, partial [Clostridiaceae bacterium]